MGFKFNREQYTLIQITVTFFPVLLGLACYSNLTDDLEILMKVRIMYYLLIVIFDFAIVLIDKFKVGASKYLGPSGILIISMSTLSFVWITGLGEISDQQIRLIHLFIC